MTLSAGDRQTLLRLARDTVVAATEEREPPDLKDSSGALREEGAAFVTLRVAGELRGCIGHTRAVSPLWESVREVARSAAERDSRFTPLRPRDLPGLTIEISVLSPMTPIRPEDVVPGTHGLYVRSGSRAGLLLPQVAVEWNWTREEFLRQTFRKGSIPEGDARAEIFAFTVERFSSAPD